MQEFEGLIKIVTRIYWRYNWKVDQEIELNQYFGKVFEFVDEQIWIDNSGKQKALLWLNYIDGIILFFENYLVLNLETKKEEINYSKIPMPIWNMKNSLKELINQKKDTILDILKAEFQFLVGTNDQSFQIFVYEPKQSILIYIDWNKMKFIFYYQKARISMLNGVLEEI